MEQTGKLRQALFNNARNPKLAWHLFKRIVLSSSPRLHPSHYARTVPVIARVLIRHGMLPEIDHLRDHIIASEASLASLLFIVKSLASSGFCEAAVSHFKSIRAHFPDGVVPVFVYNVLIDACLRDHDHGRCCVDDVLWLYKDMVLAGMSPETYTFNLLMLALCDAGRVEDARNLFDRMHEKGCSPNEYSFGILVRGYCGMGLVDKSFGLIDEMKRSGFSPNAVVYNTLISRFCKVGRTEEAEKVVERMREEGLFPDVVTFNARISVLCREGKVLEASRIFRDMQIDKELGLPQPNRISYDLMLEGFCREGMWEEAETLVSSMKDKFGMMTVHSYNIRLLGLVRKGRQLEWQSLVDEMVASGVEPSVSTYNIVIDGLCKKGMLSDARSVMRLMRSSGVCPDTVTYSALAHGYCSKGKILEASDLIHEMVTNGCSPNIYTCNILLHRLWKEDKESEAEKLLQKMNERGYGLDTVTCNIVILGLCLKGDLDKAIEILDGMWSHGSAALGNLGNSFLALVEDSSLSKKCTPDLVTYSTVISGLCKAGRVAEAKRKFAEMMSRNLRPDSAVYDIFLYTYCKEGKVSSAMGVLKDMDKRGCNRSLQTYNSLALGLAKKNQIFELYGLLDEMKDRGLSPNVGTYNSFIRCLCEADRLKDAASLLDEMIQKGVLPNITTFKILLGPFCKSGDFALTREIFEIALHVCGHKEPLYSLLFKELLSGGNIGEAKDLFRAALDRHLDIEDFLYIDLIKKICEDNKLKDANDIVDMMIERGYVVDPAMLMPVLDALNKKGNQKEAEKLADKITEMVSNENFVGGVSQKKGRTLHSRKNTPNESNWRTIIHRFYLLLDEWFPSVSFKHFGVVIHAVAKAGIAYFFERKLLDPESLKFLHHMQTHYYCIFNYSSDPTSLAMIEKLHLLCSHIRNTSIFLPTTRALAIVNALMLVGFGRHWKLVLLDAYGRF